MKNLTQQIIGHFETIYPYLFRREKCHFERERISTPDDDFLDLDWYERDSDTLAILCHGLEGSSRQNYILGMASTLSQKNMDILAWNYRSCSGEINLSTQSYHSGKIDDLETVVSHALNKRNYQQIFLVGFSLGGNLILRFLGDPVAGKFPQIKRGVAISAPLDLKDCSLQLSRFGNFLYAQNFLLTLKQKAFKKRRLLRREGHDVEKILKAKTIWEFDDIATAPLHGFGDALDYYRKCSSVYVIDQIKVPTLIINAVNDPILGEACYKQDFDNEWVQVHYPENGGHVGFHVDRSLKQFMTQQMAEQFLVSG